MRKHQGVLIVNEGPDGSGKETQTGLLCDRLLHEGYRVVRYDFPTYTRDPVADLIRTLLREQKEEWNARAWESRALLYASNRVRYRDEILAHLATPGTVVVCNRYVPSNMAHMSAYVDDVATWERRVQWIDHLEYDVLDCPRPDIVLLHTMPRMLSDVLLYRREQGAPDAHEADSAYLERVEACYRWILQHAEHTWRHIPADMQGIVESPTMVHERVWRELILHPLWMAFVEKQAQPERSRIA